MTELLRRTLVAGAVAVILGSVPVVAGFMAGIDQAPRTELSIYEGSVESDSEHPRFEGMVYLLEGEGVVVRGIQIEVIGGGEVLVAEPIGTMHGTTKVRVNLTLPHAQVHRVRLRVGGVDGTRALEVNGVRIDDGGNLVRYEEFPYEYRY